MDFAGSGRSQSENERKRKNRQIPGSCKRTEKAMEHKSNDGINFDPQMSGKETGVSEDQRKNRDHPDYSTVKISEKPSIRAHVKNSQRVKNNTLKMIMIIDAGSNKNNDNKKNYLIV